MASFTTFRADLVKEWCNLTLKTLRNTSKRKVEARARYYMQPTKVLGLTIDKGMSWDEAMAFVQKSKNLDDLFAIHPYPLQEHHVTNLLKLCELSLKHGKDSTIELDTKDMEYLITGI